MKHLTLILALTILANSIYSQITGEYREMFLEAESYFLFEEYIEALPYYKPIHEQYPDNDNINFKIGVCYLNDPYQKETSIEFLEKASENVNLKYKENSFKETRAPLEAFFYLGNAYRINGQLDKAIETYEYFKSQADPDLYDLELVNEQISACENAKELQKRPVDIDLENLGERINTRFSDVRPVISGDETKMVYIQKQPFYDALAYCEKIEDGWSFPRILMEELQVDEDAYPTSLNYEGDELIIYRSDNFIGDLYTSKLVDGFWTPPVRMNDNINTKYWESHACFSVSGDTLYFTSNRKGGFGGLDIYSSVKGEDGEWGVPSNLGPTINTRYNEETPFITNDGKTLYFSSYGHYNMGGYDVFYSTLLDEGEWSVPVNAGFPINTTDDDVFFHPVRNGTFAYFPRQIDGGFGLTDIYLYEVYSSTHPRKFRVSGILGISQLDELTNPVRIAVINQHSGDTVAYVVPDPQTGEFVFEAPVGEYELLVEGEDIETSRTTFVIPEGYKEKDLQLKQAILLTAALRLEELTRIQDDIQIDDTLLYVVTGDTVNIELTLERRSELFVSVVQDGSEVRQDSFQIQRRRFTYSYLPVPGENLLKFKLIDRRGNYSYKDVRIIYTPVDAAILMQDSTESSAAEATEETPAEMEDYLDRLTENATGELKPFLQDLELAALGIISADQLRNYLLEQAGTQDFTEEEVNRLLLLTPFDEKAATEQLRMDLAASSEGDLQTILMELNLEEEGITSEEELFLWLRDHVDEYNYTRQDINDLIIDNMQSEYMNKYTDELIILSDNEDLTRALQDTDLSKVNSLQDLYQHLISEAEKYGYSVDDVNTLFAKLAEQEELNELHSNLSEIAEGDLQMVLRELDLEKEGINKSVDLISFLMNESENHEYSKEDVVNLLLDYLEKEDLREIIKLLIGTSSGELMNLLLTLDLEQNNIRNLDDLYSYLIEQSQYYNFTEDDVIRLFLNLLKILDYEPIVQRIEVISDQIDEEKPGKGWIFFGLGGIALIILIILFTRRKESSGKDENA